MFQKTSVRMCMYGLILVAAVPLSQTSAVFTADENTESLRDFAKEYHQTNWRARRRAYSRHRDHCRDSKRTNPEYECADFNDAPYRKSRSRVEGSREAVDHPAAPEVKHVTDLSYRERQMLRRYIRAGVCPDTLINFDVKGFYELCKSMILISEPEDPITGILNDVANSRSKRAAPPATLRLRMQMLNQANDQSTRRTGLAKPSRPTTNLTDRYLELYGE